MNSKRAAFEHPLLPLHPRKRPLDGHPMLKGYLLMAECCKHAKQDAIRSISSTGPIADENIALSSFLNKWG